MKSLTEIKRWATLRCDLCGHRFRWKRDARHATSNRDGKVYHQYCIGYRQWRLVAEERLTVVDLLSDVSGLNTNDIQAIAFTRASRGEEHTARNLVWRVFYDLTKRHDQAATQ